MPSHPNQSEARSEGHKTIRDFLAQLTYADRLDKTSMRLLDVECSGAGFCIRDDGGLFVSCSGDAIMSFCPVERTRRNIYLVVDSNDHDIWMIKRMAGETNLTPSSCPSKILRLVQSA